MNDETREKTKIEYSESIEQKYKASEAEVENLQKKIRGSAENLTLYV